jgi:putative transposase
MARLARIEAAGYPHHVIQRGNNRQAIFAGERDYARYLTLLQEAASTHAIAVHAYVLMPNHVHLLMTPEKEGGLSRFMQALGRRYVRWFNDRHGRTGTLWEGRFRATVIASDEYLLACMRYIELNPVRAGLSSNPGEYRWSSHLHHVGQSIDPLIRDHGSFWALGNTPFERQSAYQGLFETPLGDELVTLIRKATNRGRALTNNEGSEALRKIPGQSAAPRPRGRPRRETS